MYIFFEKKTFLIWLLYKSATTTKKLNYIKWKISQKKILPVSNILQNSYSFKDQLAKGSYGLVYLVKDRDNNKGNVPNFFCDEEIKDQL